MKQTQLEFVKEKLIENGKISRNEMLRNYISRGGARILDCKREGWIIEGKNVKTEYGTDYVYVLVSRPEAKLF